MNVGTDIARSSGNTDFTFGVSDANPVCAMCFGFAVNVCSRKTKIDQVKGVIGGALGHEIFGFDVAMNEPFFVDCGKNLHNL